MIIKLFLISGVVIFGILILRQRPSGAQQALMRVAGAVVSVLGVIAVLFPSITIWAAHLVGVHRGTDLMLYVFVMTFLFTSLATFQRFHHLEQRIIQLTRELALRDPEGHSVASPPTK